MISVSPNTWIRLGGEAAGVAGQGEPRARHLGFGHLAVQPELAGQRLELERIAPAGEEVAEPEHQRDVAAASGASAGRGRAATLLELASELLLRAVERRAMIGRLAAGPPAARPGRRGAGAPPSARSPSVSNTTVDSMGAMREVAQPLDHGEGALAQRVGDLAVAGGDRRLHGILLRLSAWPSPAMMSWRWCFGCRRGALPGETFGEPARRVAQSRPPAAACRPARACARPAPSTSPWGTRKPVSPWRTESRRPGTVRGERRRAAGGRLDDGDAPSFLGRGKHVRPGPPQQVDLLVLAHEAVEGRRPSSRPSCAASRSSSAR